MQAAICSIIVILNDFTDYQQTKNELQLTCFQLYQLFCSAPDGLIFISPDLLSYMLMRNLLIGSASIHMI